MCEACPTTLSHGEYHILDFIVDNDVPVLESVHEDVETTGDSVLASRLAQSDVERLYHQRRDLLRRRMAASPLVEVCRRLEHAGVMPIDPAMQPLFRDVADQITRVQDEIAALREVLAFAFEASLPTGQAQANETMRQLAAWAATLRRHA